MESKQGMVILVLPHNFAAARGRADLTGVPDTAALILEERSFRTPRSGRRQWYLTINTSSSHVAR